MACEQGNASTESKSEVRVEVLKDGEALEGTAVYHAHSTTEKAKFTLSGVKIIRLEKDAILKLKVSCLGPVQKTYLIPSVTARMAISQKRWW